MKDLGDEFVSVKHLLPGVLGGKDGVVTLLKDSGFNDKDRKAAIKALRGGRKVTSPGAEDQYQSLNRYATNLNELSKDILSGRVSKDAVVEAVLEDGVVKFENVELAMV